MPNKIQDADVKGSAEVTSDSRLINDTKIYITSLAKRFDQAVAAGDLGATYYDYDVNVNYVLNGDFEDGFGGWHTFQDPANSTPDNGTGGNANSTIAQTITNPLRGTTSLLFTKNLGASRQGEGFHYNFSIHAADQAKVLQGYFDYKIVSGTYTDNAMTVWIYDDVNLKLIPVTPYQIKNHSTQGERFFFEFQTSPNSTNYRLIVYVAGTDTNAYSLQFDNFVIGPVAKLYGSPVTDWQSFTPTGTWTTNSTYSGRYRRIGDSAEIEVQINLSGAPNAGTQIFINNPAGLVIDTTKVPAAVAGESTFGIASAGDAGVGVYSGSIFYVSTTQVGIGGPNAQGTWSTTIPMTWANNDRLSLNYIIPIVGWSSSTIMSDGADTRVNALSVSNAGFATSSTWATVTSGFTINVDTHGAFSAGVWTATMPGTYKISAGVGVTATTVSTGVKILANSVVVREANAFGSSTVQATASASHVINLNAGGTIAMQAYSSAASVTSTNFTYLTIERISGPAQIAASESLVGVFTNVNNVNFTTSGTLQTVNYTNTIVDTFGGMSGSIYTVQQNGVYEVNADVLFGANGATIDAGCDLVITMGGTNYFMRDGALLNSTKEVSVVCFASQRLTVGQTIFLQSRAYWTAGTPRMSNGLLRSAKLSIKKVGI